MEVDEIVKNYLLTDDTNDVPDAGDIALVGILSGGIYLVRDTGRLGLDRDTTPEAFDPVTWALLPTLIINMRGLVPRTDIPHVPTWETGRNVLEFYFEVDGDAPYDDLYQARDRCIRILHNQRFPRITKITHINNVDGGARPLELGRAAMVRADFEVTEIRRPR